MTPAQINPDMFEVLVVGAGPVGLSLALELGLRGHRVVVVEKSDRGGHQPRAKTTNIRSMAHMRRWGIAEQIRESSPMPEGYPADIVFATRMFGFPLAHMENAYFGRRERDPRFPEPAQWIPQYTVEAVIRERLAQLPNVAVRFGAEMTALSQTEDHVVATVKDAKSGLQEDLCATYVVGADGGRSTTRELLGIELQGDHAYMANFLAIYRAPGLLDNHPLHRATSYWLVNSESPAVTGPMDKDDKWFFSTQLLQGKKPYSLEETALKIRQCIGRDVPLEVLETDVWYAHRLIAASYRDRRILLAGDSCHLHPPMGGYGMNQGIGDAVDLGWKLSAVLEGWAAPALLNTYEQERRPVHRMFVEEATKNYGLVTHHLVNATIERDDAEGVEARRLLGERIVEGKKREFGAIGVVLGYSYQPSDAIVPDGTEPEPFDPMVYQPSARPGAIAPHLWMRDGSSLYDHFAAGLTLLVLDRSADLDAARIVEAAEGMGVPLTRVPLDEPDALPLYQAKLVLIRPDQHVAWRGDTLAVAPEALLCIVTGRAGNAEHRAEALMESTGS